MAAFGRAPASGRRTGPGVQRHRWHSAMPDRRGPRGMSVHAAGLQAGCGVRRNAPIRNVLRAPATGPSTSVCRLRRRPGRALRRSGPRDRFPAKCPPRMRPACRRAGSAGATGRPFAPAQAPNADAARHPPERRQLISHSWYVPPKIAAPNPGLYVEALVLEAALEVASASATFAGSIALTMILGIPSWGRGTGLEHSRPRQNQSSLSRESFRPRVRLWRPALPAGHESRLFARSGSDTIH